MAPLNIVNACCQPQPNNNKVFVRNSITGRGNLLKKDLIAQKKTPLLEGLRGIMIFNHGLDACFFQRVGYFES
jgi:hypothetical protein